MIDLAKWAERAVHSFRQVVLGAKAPCIGYTALFMDQTDKDEVTYKFKTMMMGPPKDQLQPEDMEKLKTALDFCSIYLEKVLNDEVMGPEGEKH